MDTDSSYIRDSSNRLVYSESDVPASDFGRIRKLIASEFDLLPLGELISNGVDIAFHDYCLGELVIGIEWDNWMGFMIVAKSEASESLVHAIAEWFERSVLTKSKQNTPN